MQTVVPYISHAESDWWAASWHPCLQGIIPAHSARQDDIAALQRAGLAADVLPEQQRIYKAGFSANARFLVSFLPSSLSRQGECFAVL